MSRRLAIQLVLMWGRLYWRRRIDVMVGGLRDFRKEFERAGCRLPAAADTPWVSDIRDVPHIDRQ